MHSSILINMQITMIGHWTARDPVADALNPKHQMPLECSANGQAKKTKTWK
jgi:hypothetical protein